jgi:hypothetical protein
MSQRKLKRITIIESSDAYDCETCGCSYSYSWQIQLGKFRAGVPASASCFGGNETDLRFCFQALCGHLGLTLSEMSVDRAEFNESHIPKDLPDNAIVYLTVATDTESDYFEMSRLYAKDFEFGDILPDNNEGSGNFQACFHAYFEHKGYTFKNISKPAEPW